MENSPKTQVIERLKEAQNVLITVSNNPSVDQLSAAIGFTLMMNKLGKHATAVFSGQVPSTIEFLKPEDTLEQNTDSLRDFIISLDKSKADKLRYKVEEDVVKIFITPYRTSLSEQDLDFSQGDFNVDVVIALGVDQRDHIDQAIMAHGRILHDATVIGVMAGQAPLDVGSINWQDPTASSLCEMLVSISEAFQNGLLDGQMATAFLTGIVAETERFSNDKTSPKVMTMSAQLMAAGANQQLIATQLTAPEEPADVISDLPAPDFAVADEEGVLSLNHGTVTEGASEPVSEDEIQIDDQGTLHHTDELAKAVETVQKKSQEAATLTHSKTVEPVEEPNEPTAPSATPYSSYVNEPPQMGGTLTASSQDETLDPSTDPLSMIPQSPFPAPEDAAAVTVPTSDIQTGNYAPDMPLGPDVSASETLADIEKSVQDYKGEPVHGLEDTPDAEAARQAVLDAVNASGYDPNRPEPLQSIGAQPLDTGLNTEAGLPPTVPPPLVPPPFPLPDETTNQQ